MNKTIVIKSKKDKPYICTVGKRKTAVACIRFYNQGTGLITVNGKDISQYFVRKSYLQQIKYPLQLVNKINKYDVICTVYGSGLSGQAGAIKYGISRALAIENETEHRPLLRNSGCLTRDSRKVERKKYGLKKARKSFQFSKR